MSLNKADGVYAKNIQADSRHENIGNGIRSFTRLLNEGPATGFEYFFDM